MSADAKVWQDGHWWKGLHDGVCEKGETYHRDGNYHLTDTLNDIETCAGRLRWEIRTYPDKTTGLVGYVV